MTSPENRFTLFGVMLREEPRKCGGAVVNVSGRWRQAGVRRTAHGSVPMTVIHYSSAVRLCQGRRRPTIHNSTLRCTRGCCECECCCECCLATTAAALPRLILRSIANRAALRTELHCEAMHHRKSTLADLHAFQEGAIARRRRVKALMALLLRMRADASRIDDLAAARRVWIAPRPREASISIGHIRSGIRDPVPKTG